MADFYLKCLFAQLLSVTLYYVLPFRAVVLVSIAIGLAVVIYVGGFMYGSEIAVQLIDAHTTKIVEKRKDAIQSVCLIYANSIAFFCFLMCSFSITKRTSKSVNARMIYLLGRNIC
jgi:hypothetical protein